MLIMCAIVLLTYMILGFFWMSGIMAVNIKRAGIKVGTLEYDCWLWIFNHCIDERYGKDNNGLKFHITNTVWNIITWPFWVKEFQETCSEVNKVWLKKHDEST